MSDPGEDVTRVQRVEPRREGGDGQGWKLATVALLALLVGGGAGLLLGGGSDEQTRTVRASPRTVTATATTPTSVSVTVTAPERTVERTVTAPPETVTVTVPDEAAPDG